MKSNPALTAAIEGATNHEALKEAMLKTLAEQGIVVRDRTDAFNTRLTPQPTQDPISVTAPLPAAEPTCVRTIYPHLNDRYEIFGSSEAELDERERQIRSLFR
jgi:hypothetical protein